MTASGADAGDTAWTTPTRRLTYPRLDERASDALLDGVLAVVRSNPVFLALHEGLVDGVGSYDRDRLERDLGVAAMDPARHPFALCDGGEVVGWAETLDEHPRDGVPWIGLLEIASGWQGRGYGTEALAAIADYYRATGVACLRLGVDEGNDAALAFWTARGFVTVDERERTSPAGRRTVTVMEIAL